MRLWSKGKEVDRSILFWEPSDEELRRAAKHTLGVDIPEGATRIRWIDFSDRLEQVGEVRRFIPDERPFLGRSGAAYTQVDVPIYRHYRKLAWQNPDGSRQWEEVIPPNG